MATVNLWINPREPVVYDLPRVCMKCGADATTVKKKQFSWYPSWVTALIFLGFWPFLIVSMIMTKRQTVEVPFCHQHRNHWLMRVLVGLGVVGIFAAIGLMTFVAIESLVPAGKGDDVGGIVCGGVFVLLVIVGVGLVIFNNLTMIRPTKITEREITLTNVAPEFVKAVEEEEAEMERDIDGDVRDRWQDKRKRQPRRDDDRYDRGNKPPRKRSTDITNEDDE